MKIFVFILVFLIVTGLLIIDNNDLRLSDEEELKNFSELYYNWVGQVYSNIFSVTGHFSKLDWLPK